MPKMPKTDAKQLKEFLAYQWRSEDIREGRLKKPKRRTKAKLTPQEEKVVDWVLNTDRTKRRAHWGDWVHDWGTEVNLIDSEFQKLDIRVGSVFQGDKESRVPGIWIAYQEKAYLSERLGDFLMSPETFFSLAEDTFEKLARYSHKATVAKLERLLKLVKSKYCYRCKKEGHYDHEKCPKRKAKR